LTDVQLPDGHQGDLVFGLVLQDLLVFSDGLRDFALIEELLRGFDVFAFVIGHTGTYTLRRPCLLERCVPALQLRQAEVVRSYASRRRKGKSTKAELGVSSQLSPL